MSELTVDPEIPYVGKINTPSGKLVPGTMCRIQGVTLPEIDRFTINLQTGPNASPRDDTALHMSIRINQGYIARNSYINGEWGDEQGTGALPIGPAQSFEVLILVDAHDYKVAVNGEHFCEFRHRIPVENISHLLINGDVKVTLISWELSVPQPQNQAVSEATSASTTSSQQFNSGQGQYFPPPNAYQQQPQGPYAPPPPGPPQEQESGLGGFLEQAQAALVGAIKTGAAEKLLGGLLSSGGAEKQGYAPQNAQYGLYPQLPPDENLRRHDTQGTDTQGPLEKLIAGFFSTNQDQAGQNYPQTGQNYPQTGPGQNFPQGGFGQNYQQGPGQPPNVQMQNQPQFDGGPQSYGQYPGPQQQQQPQQNRGPLENLLSGLIPSGNNQPDYRQQPSVPHVGGEGSVGGLGSMGGILSNLAGQILSNTKQH